MAQKQIEDEFNQDDHEKMVLVKMNKGSSVIHPSMNKYAILNDGENFIDLKYTWTQLLLAAKAISSVKNSQRVFILAYTYGMEQAERRFAELTDSTLAYDFLRDRDAKRYPPILYISGDSILTKGDVPIFDNLQVPIIGFRNLNCNDTDINIVIPCNTKSPQSMCLIWWLLAREVLHFRGALSRLTKWDVKIEEFYPSDLANTL